MQSDSCDCSGALGGGIGEGALPCWAPGAGVEVWGGGVPIGHKQRVHAGESKRKRFWVKGQSYRPASWARKMWPHLG